MWLKLLTGLSMLLIVHTPSVSAEQFRVGPVYTDQPGEVSVVVELPPGVTPDVSDFRLVMNGKTLAVAQTIEDFRHSGRGLALAVCVDVSGTMDRGPLADMKEGLLVLLGKVRSQDRIALISFAEELMVASSFKNSRIDFVEAVRDLQSRGKATRLYEAVSNSLEILKDAELPKRQRVIVISDGKDERHRASAAYPGDAKPCHAWLQAAPAGRCCRDVTLGSPQGMVSG
jgi:Mg-chelatase subunit ChlD